MQQRPITAGAYVKDEVLWPLSTSQPAGVPTLIYSRCSFRISRDWNRIRKRLMMAHSSKILLRSCRIC